MKKITNIAFSIIICSLILACSKSDDATPAPTKSTAKSITAFVLSSLTPNVNATIDEANKAISAIVPVGTDLTKLNPTITISDKATVSPESGTVQDFSKSVVYIVTAEDGSKQGYTVTVQAPTNVLFYNAINGVGTLTDNMKFATISTSTMETGWTEVAGIGSNQVLFYNATTGKVMITDNLKITKIKEFTTDKDLVNLVYLGQNRLLFTNSKNGALIYKESVNLTTTFTLPNFGDDFSSYLVVGAAKDQFLVYSSKTDVSFLTDVKTDNTLTDNLSFGKGWTNIVNTGNNGLLFYNSATGVAMLTGNEKPFLKNKDFILAPGFTKIVYVGSNQILFYNSKTGEGLLTDNKTFTKLSATFPTSVGNWTAIVGL